ncbi:hypothetical protein DFH09DRAFT_1087858 [Mycena vulgaris]|nr:hypothetical protein DFH09DRAFT_1087858 [Mycena vulgaris]
MGMKRLSFHRPPTSDRSLNSALLCDGTSTVSNRYLLLRIYNKIPSSNPPPRRVVTHLGILSISTFRVDSRAVAVENPVTRIHVTVFSRFPLPNSNSANSLIRSCCVVKLVPKPPFNLNALDVSLFSLVQPHPRRHCFHCILPLFVYCKSCDHRPIHGTSSSYLSRLTLVEDAGCEHLFQMQLEQDARVWPMAPPPDAVGLPAIRTPTPRPRPHRHGIAAPLNAHPPSASGRSLRDTPPLPDSAPSTGSLRDPQALPSIGYAFPPIARFNSDSSLNGERTLPTVRALFPSAFARAIPTVYTSFDLANPRAYDSARTRAYTCSRSTSKTYILHSPIDPSPPRPPPPCAPADAQMPREARGLRASPHPIVAATPVTVCSPHAFAGTNAQRAAPQTYYAHPIADHTDGFTSMRAQRSNGFDRGFTYSPHDAHPLPVATNAHHANGLAHKLHALPRASNAHPMAIIAPNAYDAHLIAEHATGFASTRGRSGARVAATAAWGEDGEEAGTMAWGEDGDGADYPRGLVADAGGVVAWGEDESMGVDDECAGYASDEGAGDYEDYVDDGGFDNFAMYDEHADSTSDADDEMLRDYDSDADYDYDEQDTRGCAAWIARPPRRTHPPLKLDPRGDSMLERGARVPARPGARRARLLPSDRAVDRERAAPDWDFASAHVHGVKRVRGKDASEGEGSGSEKSGKGDYFYGMKIPSRGEGDDVIGSHPASTRHLDVLADVEVFFHRGRWLQSSMLGAPFEGEGRNRSGCALLSMLDRRVIY